jgi:glycosyltransferase involved in cell wall biosynthesis
MPRVSVVVPAYNVERYIQQSMQSVLSQTFRDLELIVVDDGSTDGTRALALAFDDPRVRVVTQANRGLAGARNGGIRAARGEFIAFLDADDLWREDKLARHVEHFDRRPEVGVSYSQSAFIDDDGVPLHYLQRPKLTGISARDVFLRNPVGNGSAPVIRAATLKEVAYCPPDAAQIEDWYFDENFRRTEDVECWMRIVLTTRWQFEGIDQPLTLYRLNAGGLSADIIRQYESWEAMVTKVTGYAPRFSQEHAAAARGYQLRYLARRAIRLGQAANGLSLLRKAIAEHPGVLTEEPARSMATLAAGLACMTLPLAAYRWLESFGMRATAMLMQSTRSAPSHARSI